MPRAQLRDELICLARRCRAAAAVLRNKSTEEKDRALRTVAERIWEAQTDILDANRKDLEAARAAGLSQPVLDRLTVDVRKIQRMVESVRQVAALEDPVGRVLEERKRPNGMIVRRVRVPLGVICIVYESRPDVTVEASSLAIKSGNSIILRGGSEAILTNRALARAIRASLFEAGLPDECVHLVGSKDHAVVRELVSLEGLIDLVIPRGGEALIRAVSKCACVPVLKHYKGVCHVYVDDSADLEMAEKIVLNAKCQRPATCNAMECLLVHRAVAEKFLKSCGKALMDRGVEIRGDRTALTILSGPLVRKASDSDWGAEYLDKILAVRVVDSFEDAVSHIEAYGSHHSDAIVAQDRGKQERFVREVDSAAVLVNASTRLVDGFEFGLGAEVGISTEKLHARGPMGLADLCTYKWVVEGSGQVRE
ncbi:MAG: glutamate-5-semialdehyde dehydrogenase [Planctomycetota bacterium]|nr:glutamate-5-semialdehyde dehydrogenase [Planctomycetota bacterium]